MKKKIIIAIVVLVILAAITAAIVVPCLNNYRGFEGYYDADNGTVTIRYTGFQPIRCIIRFSIEDQTETIEFSRMQEHTFKIQSYSIAGDVLAIFYIDEIKKRGSNTIFRIEILPNGQMEFIRP